MNLKTKTFVAVVILTQGCATLRNGRHQEIRVVTEVAGATVEVRCGKQQPAAVTPTTVRLPRRVEQYSFRDGGIRFEPQRLGVGKLRRADRRRSERNTRQSDQAFGEFFFGALLGGAGFGVDALTGAMWKLEPATVERKLAPK